MKRILVVWLAVALMLSMAACGGGASIKTNLTSAEWKDVTTQQQLVFLEDGTLGSGEKWTLEENIVKIVDMANQIITYEFKEEDGIAKLVSSQGEGYYVHPDDYDAILQKNKEEKIASLSRTEWKSMLDGSVLTIHADGTATKDGENATCDITNDAMTIAQNDSTSEYQLIIENNEVKQITINHYLSSSTTKEKYNYLVPSGEYDTLAEPILAKLKAELTENGYAFASNLMGTSSQRRAMTVLTFREDGTGKVEGGLYSLHNGTFETSTEREFNSWEIKAPGMVLYRLDQLSSSSGEVTEADKANTLYADYDEEGILNLRTPDNSMTYNKIQYN